jgi:hypothetical protein
VIFESGSLLYQIDAGAFSGCTSLTSISIPASVQIICRFCFFQCSALSECAFAAGANLPTIEEEAFSGCYFLNAIGLPGLSEPQ